MVEQQTPLSPHPKQLRKLTRGVYITFEGPSCSGKDVQIQLLQTRLREEGYPLVLTRQPGGTRIGEHVRTTLLHPDLRAQFFPKTESLLYWADRFQHHEEIVKPMITAGNLVLGSRDFDSSIAYQSYGRGLDLSWMKAMRGLVAGDFAPHKTILLTIDRQTFVRRSVARMEASARDREEIRVEQGAIELFERIMAGYAELAQEEPHRFVTIDATPSISSVQEAVYQEVKEALREFELEIL